jgi:hypothetical protein
MGDPGWGEVRWEHSGSWENAFGGYELGIVLGWVRIKGLVIGGLGVRRLGRFLGLIHWLNLHHIA